MRCPGYLGKKCNNAAGPKGGRCKRCEREQKRESCRRWAERNKGRYYARALRERDHANIEKVKAEEPGGIIGACRVIDVMMRSAT
jgi:hypothetical protein